MIVEQRMDPAPRNPYTAPTAPVEDGEINAGPPTQRTAALYFRVTFLIAFAMLSATLSWGKYTQWGYLLIAGLCLASAVLLWVSSPLSRYPLYAVTCYLVGGAVFGGIWNYVHNPALLHAPLKAQIISWLIPVVPGFLLINCCLFARRLARSPTIGSSDRRSRVR
jgi:hypothetical protein